MTQPPKPQPPVPNAADSERWLRDGPVVFANLRHKVTADGAALDYVRLYGIKTLLMILVPAGAMLTIIWFVDSLTRDDLTTVVGPLTIAAAVRISAFAATTFLILITGATFIHGTKHAVRYQEEAHPIEFRVADGKKRVVVFGDPSCECSQAYVLVSSVVEQMRGGQQFRHWTYMHLIAEVDGEHKHALSFIHESQAHRRLLRFADEQHELGITFIEIDDDHAIYNNSQVRRLAKLWPRWRWRF